MSVSVTEVTEIEQVQFTSVSWGAILAGAVAACAVALLLLAFGVGMGFAVVSPWSEQGVSASTFHIGAGIFLIVVAMLSSTVGGYLTGRLRRRWHGVHSDEAYFRDSAHGLVTWALATLLSATVLGSAATHILSNAAGTVAATTTAGNANDVYVDRLLRPQPAAATPAAASTPPAQNTNPPAAAVPNLNQNLVATRAEFNRVVTAAVRRNGELAGGDRSYLAQTIAARTGLSQADAEKRVDEVINQAKSAADAARKAAAKFFMWLAASMLIGALAAALAATEGGMLRDSKWYEPGWRWGLRG